MKIAICDDDQDELLFLSSLLDTYQQAHGIALHYDAFPSATALLAVAKGGAYDLYLLDVMMPGVNGMETAQEIRGFDQKAGIVFLTSSPEFAVESYRYQAQDYLLKPAQPERLYALLDTLLTKAQKSRESLGVQTKDGVTPVLFDHLAFLETVGRALFFHLSDGTVLETNTPLAEVEDILLKRSEFVRTHRSYLVNLSQLAQLTANEALTLTGERVPVSRQQYSRVREAYIAQLFTKNGVN